MASRLSLAPGFEHVRELKKGVDQNGAQNGGIHLIRRTRDGILCIKKTLRHEISINNERRMSSSHEQAAREQMGAYYRSLHEAEIDIIRMLKQARIPHINRYVYHQEVGDDLRSIDLYLRYCNLGNLHDFVGRHYNWTDPEYIKEEFIWHVFDCMARALAYLHFGCNSMTGQEAPDDWDYIVHGDLKPGNIFLTEHPGHQYPTAVLGDFGCALSRSQIRVMAAANSSVLAGGWGTPLYYPPERKQFDQANRSPQPLRGFGTHADIWALGLTILLMTGTWQHSSGKLRGENDLEQRLVAAKYSPQLTSTIRTTLEFDYTQRQQARPLVALIRREFKAAMQIHGLTHLLHVEKLPEWALPPPEFPAPTRSERSSSRRSVQPTAQRGAVGGPEGPNSLLRRATQGAQREAQENGTARHTANPANSPDREESVTNGVPSTRQDSERGSRTVPRRATAHEQDSASASEVLSRLRDIELQDRAQDSRQSSNRQSHTQTTLRTLVPSRNRQPTVETAAQSQASNRTHSRSRTRTSHRSQVSQSNHADSIRSTPSSQQNNTASRARSTTRRQSFAPSRSRASTQVTQQGQQHDVSQSSHAQSRASRSQRSSAQPLRPDPRLLAILPMANAIQVPRLFVL